MNPFLEIRGLGHCIALMSVRVVSLASEIGMGHYSDSTLCAASEAAAVGSGSLIKPDSIGFLRQEKQITELVYPHFLIVDRNQHLCPLRICRVRIPTRFRINGLYTG